jgi:CheY-like chemotaxis protein
MVIPVLVNADSAQLEQVFLNLIINARHAIRHKGSGNITIGCYTENRYVKFYIQDDGCGMSRDVVKQIFNPFFSTKGAYSKNDLGIQGTGLGLSVSYNIVRNHNGWIDVVSEENKGTTFTVVLPIQDLDSEKQSANLNFFNSKNSLSETQNTIKKNILIIDDEPEILNTFQEFLSLKNYNVYIANSGKEAFKLFLENKMDVVLLDILIPEMDGFKIFNELKKMNSGIPIIFISGQVELNIPKIKELGAYEIIKKPFSLRKLLEIFDKIFK